MLAVLTLDLFKALRERERARERERHHRRELLGFYFRERLTSGGEVNTGDDHQCFAVNPQAAGVSLFYDAKKTTREQAREKKTLKT